MFDYWSFTDYIRFNNLEAIKSALTQIFEQEGASRISQPQLTPRLDKELESIPLETARDLWIVGLFSGAPDWTIIQTWPSDLLSRRANGVTRPRLSELAIQTGRDAFHLGVYNTFFSILMEASASGHISISGDVYYNESEEGKFYDEQINAPSGSPQFQLIEVDEPMLAALRIELSPEQKQLEQLAALSEDELETIVIWDEDIDETEDDWWESSKCDGQRRHEALWKLLRGSCFYCSPCDLVERTFSRQQELEVDGSRLLYFQPAKFYRQMSITELFSKY